MSRYNSNVAIQSIVFNADGGFDITYAEQDDIHAKGTIIKQLSVPGAVVDASEVVDAIRELLDLALVERFDDPMHIARQR